MSRCFCRTRLVDQSYGRAIELRTRKAGAVLSYLALSEAKQESRERLVGLLWSRSDEEKARASLRQVVRELRSTLEEEIRVEEQRDRQTQTASSTPPAATPPPAGETVSRTPSTGTGA